MSERDTVEFEFEDSLLACYVAARYTLRYGIW